MSDSRTAGSATSSGWRTPMLILTVGVLIAVLTNGPRTGMGLFLAPMTEANGWSRETFALALAIQNIVWGIAQPIAGGFADRYGTARVIAAGVSGTPFTVRLRDR